MTIAITGATGNLGQALVKLVLQKIPNNKIRCISRSAENRKSKTEEWIKANYDEPESLQNALAGADTLMFISGSDAPAKRLKQHMNIIGQAKKAGIKKIVYTSMIGEENQCPFDGIIQVNRETEDAVRESGLKWVIGRNALFVESFLARLHYYKQKGFIHNCAGNGRTAYTTYPELAEAYLKLLLEDRFDDDTFNLSGETIGFSELTAMINAVFGLNLVYEPLSPKQCLENRMAKKPHENFWGNFSNGICQGIQKGSFEVASDFQTITGRPHKTIQQISIEHEKEWSSQQIA